MCEVCGTCRSYKKEDGYPSNLLGCCDIKDKLVAYHAICTIKKWRPQPKSEITRVSE